MTGWNQVRRLHRSDLSVEDDQRVGGKDGGHQIGGVSLVQSEYWTLIRCTDKCCRREWEFCFRV